MLPAVLTVMLFFLSPADQPADGQGIVDQSKQQARYYIQQADDDRHRTVSLWSLALLSQSNPEVSAYITDYIRKSDSPEAPYLQPFLKEQDLDERLESLSLITGSSELLLAAVLEKDDMDAALKLQNRYKEQVGFTPNNGIDYESILNRIIHDEPIDTKILPVSNSRFTHLLLFFKHSLYLSKEVLTQKYLQKYIDYWYPKRNEYNQSNLIESLFPLSLFSALYMEDDYTKISNLYKLIINKPLIPNSRFKLGIFRYLHFSMYRLGQYHNSLAITREYTVPLAGYIGNVSLELSQLHTQGVFLYTIGKVQEARENYLTVLRRSAEENIPFPKSTLYNNISLTYFKSGDIDQYLEYQTKSLELAKQAEDYDQQFSILKNLYIYEQNSKNDEQARFYLDEARKLAEQKGDPADLGSIYTSYGVFLRDQELNPELASDYFTKADSLLNPISDYSRYIDLLFEKAKLHEVQSDNRQALTIYQQIQGLSKQNEDEKNYLDALIDEARMFLATDSLDRVSAINNELKAVNLSILDFSEIIKARNTEAKYLAKIGKPDQARSILDPVIDQIIDRARNSTNLQSGYWTVEEEYLNAFRFYVDLLIDNQQYRKAVTTLDRMKTINDAALYQNPLVKSSLLDEQELTRYRRLTNQIDNLRKQQLNMSDNRRLKIQTQIDQLSAQKRMLERKITRLADRPAVDLSDIQWNLNGNERILHITELHDRYYIATITRRNVSFQVVPLTDENRTLFETAAKSVANGNTDLKKLHRIYALLDLDRIPSQTEKLIVIPDSYLYQLPLDILPVSEPHLAYSYGEANYLIEQYETQYLTSLNELRSGDIRNSKHELDFIGFGKSQFSDITTKSLVPLPHAGKEVRLISQQFTNLKRRKTVVDARSTERVFREKAPTSKIIHLATHSEVSERDPLFSSIYMSEQQKQTDEANLYNSQIFAYELFEMNLSSDLIMFNSCESGSGSYLQGSGIMGISRALRYAGAKSLVLNLWSVNDMMASDFAVQFYTSLNKGHAKSQSLREAKLQFLKNKNANPHYWGSYMMLGENEPVVHPNRMTDVAVAASFMLYLLSLVSISYIKQRFKTSG